MARRIDQIDRAIAPSERNTSAIDCDAALLLFRIVIRFRGAFIDLTESMLGAGVIEQVLGRRGLAGINVGDHAEIANLRQIELG
jgi:hypothetical protein